MPTAPTAADANHDHPSDQEHGGEADALLDVRTGEGQAARVRDGLTQRGQVRGRSTGSD